MLSSIDITDIHSTVSAGLSTNVQKRTDYGALFIGGFKKQDLVLGSISAITDFGCGVNKFVIVVIVVNNTNQIWAVTDILIYY